MSPLAQILKGWRNGFFYGGRTRIVHSLVMTLLFKTIDKKSIKDIIKFSYEHAANLGKFAFVYKTLCILLAKTFYHAPWNSFISGLIGGYVVFSQKTPVNYQIVLYLFSRVVMGLIYLIYKKIIKQRIHLDENRQNQQKKYFTIASGVAWGIIMFLFAFNRNLIQNSISSSMEFIYEQSDKPYQNWRELIPFKIPF